MARRDLSLRVKERIQQLGFAVLAALMIVVLYNDVITNVLLMRKGMIPSRQPDGLDVITDPSSA